ncbi:hypothetical protein CXF87_14940 [Halomonas sp. MES3-P3E]|nr:hypothetical protein CXF87_14940 [Halomonas sp. MES3-P3E]
MFFLLFSFIKNTLYKLWFVNFFIYLMSMMIFIYLIYVNFLLLAEKLTYIIVTELCSALR